MGFEPQTADKPLVDVHKRTTKVNIVVAVGVAIFLLVGVCYMLWASKQEARGEPVKEQVETPK